MKKEKYLNHGLENGLNHGLDRLRDFFDFKKVSKKSVQSESSVAIRDSDKVQQEIEGYLKQLTQ